jgi:hypothetical protein
MWWNCLDVWVFKTTFLVLILLLIWKPWDSDFKYFTPSIRTFTIWKQCQKYDNILDVCRFGVEGTLGLKINRNKISDVKWHKIYRINYLAWGKCLWNEMLKNRSGELPYKHRKMMAVYRVWTCYLKTERIKC